MSDWRGYSAKIIRETIKEFYNDGEVIWRKRLKERYPFGQRTCNPYKIWCDEVRKHIKFAKIYGKP